MRGHEARIEDFCFGLKSYFSGCTLSLACAAVTAITRMGPSDRLEPNGMAVSDVLRIQSPHHRILKSYTAQLIPEKLWLCKATRAIQGTKTTNTCQYMQQRTPQGTMQENQEVTAWLLSSDASEAKPNHKKTKLDHWHRNILFTQRTVHTNCWFTTKKTCHHSPVHPGCRPDSPSSHSAPPRFTPRQLVLRIWGLPFTHFRSSGFGFLCYQASSRQVRIRAPDFFL